MRWKRVGFRFFAAYFVAGRARICWTSAIFRVWLAFMSLPGLAPAGDLLFFASPKKPKEKKGDPQSGPLRGSLKKLKEPENLETSRLCRRRTSRFFNPSPPAFLSPARTGWEIKPESDTGAALYQRERRKSKSAPVFCFHPVLVEVRSAGQSGPGQALV